MALFRLNDNDDWELEHEDQDIRGWEVVDATGDLEGTIADLVISDETKMVETVVLDDGREFPAEDIEIGDEIVYLEGVAELEEVHTTPTAYGGARARRIP